MAASRTKGKIPQAEIVNVGFYAVLFGFVGSKLLSFAETNRWDGFSEFGGILAAAIVALIFLRAKKLSVPLFLDIVGPALLLAEAIARIGCFAVHDHIGKQSNFFLATNFNGVTRHDVGLYLSLAAFLGFLFIFILEKIKKFAPGSIGLLSLIWFFGARFFLDFLKADDFPYAIPMYWGLTIAQYFAILFLIVSAVLFIRQSKANNVSLKL